MTENLPSFDHVQAVVKALNIEYSPFELHGLLCGFLCAGGLVDEKVFLKTLLQHAKNATDDSIGVLAQLYRTTKSQLNTMTFEFNLLMPDDAAPLGERAKALGEWCNGFCAGLLDAGLNFEKLRQEESREALQHLSEIADIEHQYTTVTEEDEKAFFEVFEYVRMAALMVHTELNVSAEASQQGSGTVH